MLDRQLGRKVKVSIALIFLFLYQKVHISKSFSFFLLLRETGSEELKHWNFIYTYITDVIAARCNTCSGIFFLNYKKQSSLMYVTVLCDWCAKMAPIYLFIFFLNLLKICVLLGMSVWNYVLLNKETENKRYGHFKYASCQHTLRSGVPCTLQVYFVRCYSFLNSFITTSHNPEVHPLPLPPYFAPAHILLTKIPQNSFCILCKWRTI